VLRIWLFSSDPWQNLKSKRIKLIRKKYKNIQAALMEGPAQSKKDEAHEKAEAFLISPFNCRKPFTISSNKRQIF
jgi:hypothetical protein